VPRQFTLRCLLRKSCHKQLLNMATPSSSWFIVRTINKSEFGLNEFQTIQLSAKAPKCTTQSILLSSEPYVHWWINDQRCTKNRDHNFRCYRTFIIDVKDLHDEVPTRDRLKMLWGAVTLPICVLDSQKCLQT